MGKTALLYAAPAALLVWNWLRLENPHQRIGQAVWIAALALAPALVRTLALRIGVGVVAFLLAARSALGVSILDARPFDGHHDFFGPLGSRFTNGFLDFYEVQLPFNGHERPLMHGVVLLAVFGFGAALALALAAGRPVVAALLLVIGAGWPATLLLGGDDFTRGALLLAVVLSLLFGLRRGTPRLRQALVGGALVVLAALIASSSSAVAKREFLHWRAWDFYNRPQTPVDVAFVWDAHYDGIHFPKKVTTVLRIKAPSTSTYWRATTLDVFARDRWIELLTPARSRTDGDLDELIKDPLLPASAQDRQAWVKQEVTIAALRDPHLIATSVPVAFVPPSGGSASYFSGGVARTSDVPSRGSRYTVWSYEAQPTPAQLSRSKARYPNVVRPYLRVAPGLAVPPFRASGREAAVERIFGRDRFAPYRVLYANARTVAGRARTPYAAAVALEEWFRTSFQYDERPPSVGGIPPLVGFVSETKQGYCQHFAGAMALMLRYLGIPARVAVGFTSGRYDPGESEWTITDHDAHAWVEVWFQGWGWLPFDPTPSRGRLSATYTASSPGFPAAIAAALSLAQDGGISSDLKRLGLGQKARSTGPGADVARLGEGGSGSDGGNGSPAGDLLRLLAALAAGLIVLVALAKLVLRRARYLTRDPRRLAAAARRELVDFLTDQRVQSPGSATAQELAALVRDELDVDARWLAEALSAARFGPPEGASAAADRARRELRLVLRQIRKELNRTDRALGLVSLRSLGLTG